MPTRRPARLRTWMQLRCCRCRPLVGVFQLGGVEVGGVVEASPPKVSPMVNFASANNISGTVVKPPRGGKEPPRKIFLPLSSLGSLIDCSSALKRVQHPVLQDSGLTLGTPR